MTGAKIKLASIFLVVFVLAGMFAFRKTYQVKQEEVFQGNLEKVDIAQNDLNESDEDLFNVDYSDFYNKLSPYGEWIEVTGNDIGVDLNKSTAGIGASHRTVSFADVFGPKDAYAADLAFGAVFIWRPSPDLAVSLAMGEPAPVYYTPYTNGQWLYTDAGWYFQAPTPYEEIVHHYGRWVFSPTLGWVWLPGRVWAPSWVEWRVSPGYIAWAPVPPTYYIVNSYYYPPPIPEERFIIVENRYFLEPVIYNYIYTYDDYSRYTTVYEMQRIDGIVVRDNVVYNVGPDITTIERDWGSKVDIVKINRVSSYDQVKRSGGEVYTYSPAFRKLKDKTDISVMKPDKFEKYIDVRNRTTENGQYSHGQKQRSDEKSDITQNNNRNRSDNPGSMKQRKNDRRDNISKNDGIRKSRKDGSNDNTNWSKKQEKSRSNDYRVEPKNKQNRSNDNMKPKTKQDRGRDNTQWKSKDNGSKDKGNNDQGNRNKDYNNGQKSGPKQKDMNSGKSNNQKPGNNKASDNYSKPNKETNTGKNDHQNTGKSNQNTGKNNGRGKK